MLDEALQPSPPPSEDAARRRQRRRGGLAVVLALVVVAGLLGAGLATASGLLGRLAGTSAAPAEDYPGPGTGEVIVQVQRGETASDVGRRLAREGVVASARSFSEAAAADNEQAGSLQPGYYRMRERMSGRQAFELLLDPSSRAETRVTVPEGLRLEETLAVLAKGTGIPVDDFRRALERGNIGLPAAAQGRAQGFLFPATYEVPPGARAVDVLRLMTARYAQAVAAAGVERGGTFSAYEVVTIASLVEGEARLPQDYGKVARVIHNRLAKRMALELDSTVNYVLKTNKQAPSYKDIEVDDPYNTYQNPGLPPGPISSPGERALRVAQDPPPGDWLFFVTTDAKTGETKFTGSYAEFLRFKREYHSNKPGQG